VGTGGQKQFSPRGPEDISGKNPEVGSGVSGGNPVSQKMEMGGTFLKASRASGVSACPKTRPGMGGGGNLPKRGKVARKWFRLSG